MEHHQCPPVAPEFIALQQDAAKVKGKFHPRFGKVVPAKTVLRFYQIENKLDTIVALGIVPQVPLTQ